MSMLSGTVSGAWKDARSCTDNPFTQWHGIHSSHLSRRLGFGVSVIARVGRADRLGGRQKLRPEISRPVRTAALLPAVSRSSSPQGWSPFLKVEAIQVDGRSEFMAEFEQACQDKAIRLYVLPPKCPQMNGGVERCKGAWRYEFYSVYDLPRNVDDLNPILDGFQHLYNYHRPHGALGGSPRHSTFPNSRPGNPISLKGADSGQPLARDRNFTHSRPGPYDLIRRHDLSEPASTII
jgi:Integrase core domain